MKLKVIGSGSSGNCYLLEDENTSLVIEAGVVFSKVKEALDFNVSKVVGVLCSHEHGDHFKYVKDFLKAGIDVYCSKGTAGELKHHRLHYVSDLQRFQVGEFKIMPFSVIHDAAEPVGFIVNHPDTGNILFLTDSYFSEYIFKDLRHILLEVNYDETILEENVRSGRVHESMRHRIITNHMGLGTAIDLLAANDLSKVQNIILIHLSDTNSDENGFIDSIQKATGKTVKVASKNTVISLNKRPF